MYCIKCGVKLSETEKKCPLCNTVVYHPEFSDFSSQPLYPSNKMPKSNSGTKALCGAGIILFLIPFLICLLADLLNNGRFDWFGYVAGALSLGYVAFALPLWFKKPNPVIFTPCSFVAAVIYLMYINLKTDGDWFLSFALPLTVMLCVIVCATVTLFYYLKRGRLYILGSCVIAMGGFAFVTELLMKQTFGLVFVGWSFYPLVSLFLLGGLLIYLAINSSAREFLEQKLFF